MPSFARAAGVLPGGSWRLPVLVVTRTDASAAVPTAGDDPQDDQHDHELTPAELAGFVVELVDARATIDFLTGRVSALTSLLDRSANTAYECHDCADLRAELHSNEQSLASSAELLLQARDEKGQAEHELRLIRLRCLALEHSLDECHVSLVAARAEAAATSRMRPRRARK